MLTAATRAFFVLEDHDGTHHYNYVDAMVACSGWWQPDSKDLVQAWLDITDRTVQENLDNFAQQEKWNERAKWVWLGEAIEKAKLKLDLEIRLAPLAQGI
jgi:hypothetical protein